jgi:hypothetical protein
MCGRSSNGSFHIVYGKLGATAPSMTVGWQNMNRDRGTTLCSDYVYKVTALLLCFFTMLLLCCDTSKELWVSLLAAPALVVVVCATCMHACMSVCICIAHC